MFVLLGRLFVLVSRCARNTSLRVVARTTNPTRDDSASHSRFALPKWERENESEDKANVGQGSYVRALSDLCLGTSRAASSYESRLWLKSFLTLARAYFFRWFLVGRFLLKIDLSLGVSGFLVSLRDTRSLPPSVLNFFWLDTNSGWRSTWPLTSGRSSRGWPSSKSKEAQWAASVTPIYSTATRLDPDLCSLNTDRAATNKR